MQMDKTKTSNDFTSDALAREIVKILIEKQGGDVRLYDVKESASITDYYVNVTGRSLTHVGALAEELVDLLSERGRDAARVEGKRGNSWILIDYLDVIVNVFNEESRNFYNFERLLPEDGLVDITELIAEVDKKFDTN